MRRFGERPHNLCVVDQTDEDVRFGECMEKLGVKTAESLDSQGRSRFHCLKPEEHLSNKKYPDWIYSYDKHKGKIKVSFMFPEIHV